MNLGQYIEVLQSTKDKPIKLGLEFPHSWRSSYRQLAFEPIRNTTVAKMLKEALSACDNTYTSWKGGEYQMSDETPINIDYQGMDSGGELLESLLKELGYYNKSVRKLKRDKDNEVDMVAELVKLMLK